MPLVAPEGQVVGVPFSEWDPTQGHAAEAGKSEAYSSTVYSEFIFQTTCSLVHSYLPGALSSSGSPTR